MKRILNIISCFTMCICALQLNAQLAFVQKLDSIKMLIGDQQHLTLLSSNKRIAENPFSILDTLSWFHIIDKGDWVAKDQNFERKIVFTVFDSGYFRIPPLGIFFEKDTILQFGNPLNVEVNYPADSLNILRPIKPIEETKSAFKYLYLIILAVLFIGGMLFVLWQFFKADRIKPSIVHLHEEKQIWEQCLQSLKELDEKKLWQSQLVKEYYDELNLILRKYLSAGLKIPALENTSSEIIDFIQTNKSEIKNWDILKDCFGDSDLVKFANLLPDPEKNKSWMDFSKNFIEENKNLSELILEETRMHWLALLGESMSSQFENPLETVPAELINLYDGSKTGTVELLHKLIHKVTFQLPVSWIKWHEMHTGIFYRWHFNILNISKHKMVQAAILIFILPFVTVFLPFMIVINTWKKQNIFSRGIFGLSGNNKLLIRKNK